MPTYYRIVINSARGYAVRVRLRRRLSGMIIGTFIGYGWTRKMVNVHLARDFDIAAGKVWALLEDFGNISWAPGIDKTEVIGEGVGMTRRLHIAGMEPIDEVLTAMDKSAMTFSYNIPRGIPMPVTDYSANAKVTPLGEGRCHVDWYGRAEPVGISEKELGAMLTGTYEMLLQWIHDHLAAA